MESLILAVSTIINIFVATKLFLDECRWEGPTICAHNCAKKLKMAFTQGQMARGLLIEKVPLFAPPTTFLVLCTRKGSHMKVPLMLKFYLTSYSFDSWGQFDLEIPQRIMPLMIFSLPSNMVHSFIPFLPVYSFEAQMEFMMISCDVWFDKSFT